MALYLKTKNPGHNIQDIKRDLEWFSFLWTMIHIEKVVNAINVPEIRQAIYKVVEECSTPAYDVIGYFALLDTAKELGDREKVELAGLLKKHKYPFVTRVLSLRTQHYMKTHRSKAMVEQAICSLLDVKYYPRLRPSR